MLPVSDASKASYMIDGSNKQFSGADRNRASERRPCRDPDEPELQRPFHGLAQDRQVLAGPKQDQCLVQAAE